MYMETKYKCLLRILKSIQHVQNYLTKKRSHTATTTTAIIIKRSNIDYENKNFLWMKNKAICCCCCCCWKNTNKQTKRGDPQCQCTITPNRIIIIIKRFTQK